MLRTPPSKRTFVISSLILTVGLPETDDSLTTMFNARLFSTPPLDALLKSFVSDVPMPNEPTRESACQHDARRGTAYSRTFETDAVTFLLQLHGLLHVQRVGEDDKLLRVIHADLLIDRLRAMRKREGITRVLP